MQNIQKAAIGQRTAIIKHIDRFFWNLPALLKAVKDDLDNPEVADLIILNQGLNSVGDHRRSLALLAMRFCEKSYPHCPLNPSSLKVFQNILTSLPIGGLTFAIYVPRVNSPGEANELNDYGLDPFNAVISPRLLLPGLMPAEYDFDDTHLYLRC